MGTLYGFAAGILAERSGCVAYVQEAGSPYWRDYVAPHIAEATKEVKSRRAPARHSSRARPGEGDVCELVRLPAVGWAWGAVASLNLLLIENRAVRPFCCILAS